MRAPLWSVQQVDCRLRLRLAEQEGELQLRSGVSNAGEGKKFPCYKAIRHDRTVML